MTSAPFTYRPGPHEDLKWTGALVQIGVFHARPDDPDFETAGKINGHPTLVFPRTPVRIRFQGLQPFTTDLLTPVLYNAGDTYRREAVAGLPDRCDWFHYAPRILDEALRERRTGRGCDAISPFPVPRVSIPPTLYAVQRAVFEHVLQHEAGDALFVEETMIRVLDEILRVAFEEDARRPDTSRSRHLALAAQDLLAARFLEDMTVEEIAEDLGCSVYHLCRVFKSVTGTTLHSHRLDLRIARSLEAVAEPGCDLATVAFDVGFSSHSHFSATFKRRLGVTPSEFRQGIDLPTLRSLRSKLLGS